MCEMRCLSFYFLTEDQERCENRERDEGVCVGKAIYCHCMSKASFSGIKSEQETGICI